MLMSYHESNFMQGLLSHSSFSLDESFALLINYVSTVLLAGAEIS